MLTQLMDFHSLNLGRAEILQDLKFREFPNSVFTNVYGLWGPGPDAGYNRAAVLNEQ